jgi:hypothetical protein
MDGTLCRRAVLAVTLGWAMGAGLAHADAPLTPTPAQAPAVIVVNGMIYSNTGVPAAAPVATAAPASVPGTVAPETVHVTEADQRCAWQHPLRTVWETHPISTFWHDHVPHCWTHFNNYSCSTWESEYAFIFGSCRNFFGEACMGKPEPAFPGEQPPRNICPNCPRH